MLRFFEIWLAGFGRWVALLALFVLVAVPAGVGAQALAAYLGKAFGSDREAVTYLTAGCFFGILIGGGLIAGTLWSVFDNWRFGRRFRRPE